MKASVRIGRVSTMKGDGYIVIDIEEDVSGLTVCTVEMSYEEFAQCITGLSGCEGEFKTIANQFGVENYGKKRLVETVSCNKVRSFKREDQSAEVERHFKQNYEPEGWMLWDDGVRLQQHGKDHQYTLWKFVEAEDA